MQAGTDYIEIEFAGKSRKLRFRVIDVADFQTRLSTPTRVADHDVILERLGGLNVPTVYIGLFLGLRHEDAKLKAQDVPEHVQKYCDAGGTVDELAAALIRALNRCGVRPRMRESVQEDSADPSGATS